MSKKPKIGKPSDFGDSAKNKTWVEVQHDQCLKAFNQQADNFLWMMKDGGGIKNIHMLETLRELEWLYLKGAAYGRAAEDAKGS